jgi:hypothetical protein
MPGRSSRCSLTRARGGRGSTLMKRSSDRLEMGPERWLRVAVVAEDEMERAISAHRWLHVFFLFSMRASNWYLSLCGGKGLIFSNLAYQCRVE